MTWLWFLHSIWISFVWKLSVSERHIFLFLLFMEYEYMNSDVYLNVRTAGLYETMKHVTNILRSRSTKPQSLYRSRFILPRELGKLESMLLLVAMSKLFFLFSSVRCRKLFPSLMSTSALERTAFFATHWMYVWYGKSLIDLVNEQC